MNYDQAIRKLIGKKEREQVLEELNSGDIKRTAETIRNVVNGKKRYSNIIHDALHNKALQVLSEIQIALSQRDQNTKA